MHVWATCNPRNTVASAANPGLCWYSPLGLWDPPPCSGNVMYHGVRVRRWARCIIKAWVDGTHYPSFWSVPGVPAWARAVHSSSTPPCPNLAWSGFVFLRFANLKQKCCLQGTAVLCFACVILRGVSTRRVCGLRVVECVLSIPRNAAVVWLPWTFSSRGISWFW